MLKNPFIVPFATFTIVESIKVKRGASRKGITTLTMQIKSLKAKTLEKSSTCSENINKLLTTRTMKT